MRKKQHVKHVCNIFTLTHPKRDTKSNLTRINDWDDGLTNAVINISWAKFFFFSPLSGEEAKRGWKSISFRGTSRPPKFAVIKLKMHKIHYYSLQHAHPKSIKLWHASTSRCWCVVLGLHLSNSIKNWILSRAWVCFGMVNWKSSTCRRIYLLGDDLRFYPEPSGCSKFQKIIFSNSKDFLRSERNENWKL